MPCADENDYYENSGLTADCAGYAVSRVFGKTWSDSDLHSAKYLNLNTVIPPVYFTNTKKFSTEAAFVYNVHDKDIIGFSGNHWVYVSGRNINNLTAAGITIDEVKYESDPNSPYIGLTFLQVIHDLTKQNDEWWKAVEIYRVKKQWDIKYQTNLENHAGHIKINNVTLPVPYTLEDQLWGNDNVKCSDVMDGTTRNGYFLTWDATNYASGTYLLLFKSNEKTEVKRLVLLK